MAALERPCSLERLMRCKADSNIGNVTHILGEAKARG